MQQQQQVRRKTPPIVTIFISLVVIYYICMLFIISIVEDRRSKHMITTNKILDDSNWRLRKNNPRDEKDDDKQKRRSNKVMDILSSIPPRRFNLTAYLEPPHEYYHHPTTSSSKDDDDNGNDDDDKYTHLITPLPLRTLSPHHLRPIPYPHVSSCSDLPQNLPVDPGFTTLPNSTRPLLLNVENHLTAHSLSNLTLAYCPVDTDPFLPWIHDVFTNGDAVSVVAQNRRRCFNGPGFEEDIEALRPQVALLQPVALRRVRTFDDIPTDLWDDDETTRDDVRKGRRYRLSNHEAADEDAKETRFICRFHTGYDVHSSPRLVWGETLSTYPFNPEYVNFRKFGKEMLTNKGFDDNKLFWLSTLQFDCPLPSELQQSSSSVLTSGLGEGRVFLDIVPIRTAPRTNEERFFDNEFGTFDADKVWGRNHVLPKVEASGRWSNIPVCRPPGITPSTRDEEVTTTHGKNRHDKTTTTTNDRNDNDDGTASDTTKPHYLVACLWSSASYQTRANALRLSDAASRFVEWMEFHLLVGVDHFYVYDNSPPSDSSNLSFLESYFGNEHVTVVPWPFRVCNNNVPAHPNTGERSSQYAAEQSCRRRYGGSTEWMMVVDVDEYVVPMGTFRDLKSALRDVRRRDGEVEILSLTSSRAYLTYGKVSPYYDDTDCQPPHQHNSNTTSPPPPPPCFIKTPNTTYLSTYNCDTRRRLPGSTTPLRHYTRAKKQIFRPSYVLSHFVHYSTVTRGLLRAKIRKGRYNEPKKKERWVDEGREMTMIHAKTWEGRDTAKWRENCRLGKVRRNYREECRMGIPWPIMAEEEAVEEVGEEMANKKANEEGLEYNCYKIGKVENDLLPLLLERMEERRQRRQQR